MDKLVIGSTRKSAGKTSTIIGLAKLLNKKIGYMKPFGDRLIYRKKRLWDYDSALVTNTMGLTENPEDMTIGFEHSKLRYMFDEARTKEKLTKLIADISQDKDLIFVEGGKDFSYGVSVFLDAISVARHIDGKLVMVVSGDEDAIMDDISFMKRFVNIADVDFRGVIVNKVQDIDDFKETYLQNITEMGINILGVVPFKAELTNFSVNYLSENLFAKVIAGENGLNNIVKNIFVGAMSTNAAVASPLFSKESKLMIIPGDRSDTILAYLEKNTSGIVLTNNILPPHNILSRATERNIPLLLVPFDTYAAAKRIDNLEPLLTKDDGEKISLLASVLAKHVNIKDIADI